MQEYSKDKDYGLTHIHTADGVIPIIKTFINLAIFKKLEAEQEQKRKIQLAI